MAWLHAPVAVPGLAAVLLHSLACAQDPPAPLAATPTQPPLSVAVVGAADSPRTKQLTELLRRAGHRPRAFDRAATAATTTSALHAFHVVVVDWTGMPGISGALPLGPLDRQDRPTVLLGDTGARFADLYGIPTPAAMAALAEADRGPEMERLPPPEGAATEVWRQGHLFHFPLATAPGDWPAAEQRWFLASVAAAAHFVTDRPIVRRAPPPGTPAAQADAERRARITAAVQQLGIDPWRREALLGLPSKNGDAAAPELALLGDLIDGGPDDPSQPNGWRSWLTVHGAALCRDTLSARWRVDPVAFWRGLPSAGLRGAARADGLVREPAAAALAAKVSARYGARGLADLHTFTAWHGRQFVAWDRGNGVFRVENHTEPAPGARVTPWQAAVLDTAADVDLVRGGGPPPRPRVSARGSFREFVAALFLPLLLEEPGTSVAMDQTGDAEGRQRLRVRLAGRGLDPTAEFVLCVDAATGDVVAIETWERGRLQLTRSGLVAVPCGPLLLTAGGELVRGRTRHDDGFVDPAWNPVLPAGFASAPQRLATPPEK